MHSTRETREMANKIRQYILENPERHSQHSWGDSHNVCNTTMCIAGTAVYIDNDKKSLALPSGQTFSARARDLLGLTPEEGSNLFYDMDNTSAFKKLVHISLGVDWDLKQENDTPDGAGYATAGEYF